MECLIMALDEIFSLWPRFSFDSYRILECTRAGPMCSGDLKNDVNLTLSDAIFEKERQMWGKRG